MGKLVRWNKRRGWEVGLTPYQYRIEGMLFFQRMRFKGLRPRFYAGRIRWR